MSYLAPVESIKVLSVEVVLFADPPLLQEENMQRMNRERKNSLRLNILDILMNKNMEFKVITYKKSVNPVDSSQKNNKDSCFLK